MYRLGLMGKFGEGHAAMGEKSRIDELLNQLLSNDFQNREQSIKAVLKHNSLAIASASLDQLLKASSDSDDDIRAIVLAALGKKADRGALTVLEERLARDPCLKVRLRAARALGELCDPRALSLISDLLS